MKIPRSRAFAAILVITLSVPALPTRAQGPRELWVRRYDGPTHQYDEAKKVVLDKAGNVIVTGESGEPRAAYTAKYAAATGTLLWEQRHAAQGALKNLPNDVTVDARGNVIITGAEVFGSYLATFYTAKYAAADGRLLWERRVHVQYCYCEGRSVAVDSANNVIVSGSSCSDFYDNIEYTAKYAAADGALLWEHRGPVYSYANKVVVDREDNAIIAGTRFRQDTYGDYYTAKLSGATGGLIWGQRYDGPAYGWDEAASVTIDPAGNIAVTGSSPYYYFFPEECDHGDCGAGAFYDTYTAKYASKDGAQLWGKTYHSPTGVADSYGTDVITDSAGNVIVTGSANDDLFTAKYAAADGARLWKKRRIGLHTFGRLAAVAVDSANNVIVTGYDGHSPYDYQNYPDYDYCYTAKYAAANGALIWERRYPAFLEGHSKANSLAVGTGFVVVAGVVNGDFVTVKYLDGPTVRTSGAEVMASNRARLSGTVNPNGLAAIAAFEYGTDPTFANAISTSPSAVGSGLTALPLAATLSSLRPQTKYYYRAIGTGSGVTLRGEVMTFTTPSAPTPVTPVARSTPRPMYRR